MTETNPGGSARPPSDDFATALASYRRAGSHWRRYEFAARIGRGRSVLDLGCGHGFGAAILDRSVARYVGVDVDPEALAWASRVIAPRCRAATFRSPTPATSDAETAGRFDLVLCFEVVEHVSDPVALLKEATAALAPGGSLLVSTPNGAVSRGDPHLYRSPYHLREYTTAEVGRMLDEAGLQGRYYREQRRDRLDALALRWGMAESGRRSGAGAANRGMSWFSRHLDGPAFWTIVPTEPGRMSGATFSTIFVEATPGGRGTPGLSEHR